MLRVKRSVTATLLMSLIGLAPATAQPQGRAQAERAVNFINLIGEWTGRYHEDQPDRVPGEEPGNFSGIPINESARMYGESWDVARHSVPEHQCAPYALPYIFHGPSQFRIWEEKHPDTQELIAIKMYLGTYQQNRTIWMDGRPHPPEYAAHTFMGFSTGQWNADILTVTTTHLKAGYFRRSGIPSSDRTTLVEHWIRHGNLLSHVTIATDPVYLTEPWIRSQEFVLMERGNLNWLYNCEYANEIPRPKHSVPHYLPGQNPWKGEFTAKYGVPAEAVRGGVESTLPEWKPGDPAPPPRPGANGGFGPDRQPERLADGEVRTVHVQGNVHMIVGAGSNIAVQVGDDGVLVVDTGSGTVTDKVLAAIRQLSDKEIRWVLNTSHRPDHTAGNADVAQSGRTVNGNVAAVVAHENVAAHMIKAGIPDEARPYNTYFEETRDFPFNGEPIVLYHDDSAVTDADTMVFFRRSDVLVAGDIFTTTAYPAIDPSSGGSVAGTIRALNRILDLTIPSKSLQEAGTYVIPGHGRISDEADVVMYRDMLVIVNDRIGDMVKRGMTLEQVKAARPTLDYDPRYGAASGPMTTETFIEAVYREHAGPGAGARAARD